MEQEKNVCGGAQELILTAREHPLFMPPVHTKYTLLIEHSLLQIIPEHFVRNPADAVDKFQYHSISQNAKPDESGRPFEIFGRIDHYGDIAASKSVVEVSGDGSWLSRIAHLSESRKCHIDGRMDYV